MKSSPAATSKSAEEGEEEEEEEEEGEEREEEEEEKEEEEGDNVEVEEEEEGEEEEGEDGYALSDKRLSCCVFPRVPPFLLTGRNLGGDGYNTYTRDTLAWGRDRSRSNAPPQ